MDRRNFSKNLLMTLTSVAFLDTLFTNDLFAQKVKSNAAKWLQELQSMCLDLRIKKITALQWQDKINEFHSKLPMEDLLKLIDFDEAIKAFEYPDLGVTTKDPIFPAIAGIEKFSFKGRIFGMQKDRAIIPHGHQHMTSCHRVMKGEFLLRQYNRLQDEGDQMFIKQSIEETSKVGSFSSISDDQNNVHWLVATTPRAYTFDVIVAGLSEKPTEIDNIDIYNAVKIEGDILKVKKISVEDALKKYGKTHH